MTLRIERLKRRADFLRVAAARRKWGRPGLVLQAAPTPAIAGLDPDADIRVGFTVSKKVGNAVRRNRAKRRLRAAVDLVLPEIARPGTDYVVIGRVHTPTRPFDLLLQDLHEAVKRVHAPPRDGAKGKTRDHARGREKGKTA